MGMTSIRRVSQHMLKGVVVVLVVAMAIGIVFVPGLFNMGGGTPDYKYHGPAVRVNGITLKDAEFQENLAGVAQDNSQAAMYGYEIGAEEMREEALQRSIRDLVLRSEIKKNKIGVANADVDLYYNRLAKQYFPTKTEKVDFYERNGFKSDRQFKQEIRRYLEQLYLFLALAEKKKIGVKVTQAEISDAYASVTVGHIMLATEKDAPGTMTEAEAMKKAGEIHAKLKAGEDWDQLAKQYSTDSTTKDKGGSFGEVKISAFKSQFEAIFGKAFVDAALALKENGFSEPVKSSRGYHLLKMTQRKEATGPEFERESRLLKAELVTQKFAGSGGDYGQWIEARVADADVTILDPALRAYQLKVKAEGESDRTKAKDIWSQAANFYERAVRMRQHRWDRDIFLSAMGAFGQVEQWDKVVNAGRQALKLFKEDFEIHASLGKALYKRAKGKDKAESLALLKKARSLAGDDMGSLGKVKSVYDELKLAKEAKSIETRITQLYQEELRQQELYQQQLQDQSGQGTTGGTTGSGSTESGTGSN